MAKAQRLEFRVTSQEERRLRADAHRLGFRFLSDYIRQRLFDQEMLLLHQKIIEIHHHLLGKPGRERRAR